MGCGSSGQKEKKKDEPQKGQGVQKGVGPGATGDQAAKGQEETPFGGVGNDGFVPGFTFGDETDGPAPAPAPPPAKAGPGGGLSVKQAVTRRSGVSAEELEIPESWTAPVVPKSAEIAAHVRACLSKHPLFGSFQKEDLDTVVAAMSEEKHSPGSEVLKQGDKSSGKYYIITEGEVDIIKQDKGVVATFKPGNGFGDLELMYPGPCAATVKAKTSLTTFTLDRDTYRVLVMRASLARQKLYKDLVSGVSFLKDLNEHQRMTLADALSPCEFQIGEKIIAKGSDNEWMHIILNGTVSVIGRGEDGQEHNVCDFGPGQTVGELEFLNGHACVADVVAKTECTTCRLHRDHFELCMGPLRDFLQEKAKGEEYNYYQGFTFGDDDPLSDGGGGISSDTEATPADSDRPGSAGGGRVPRREAVSAAPLEDDPDFTPPSVPKSDEDRAALREVTAQCSLLKALHETDREAIIDAMEQAAFPKGTQILQQGDSGEHFYIISQGSVRVVRDGTELCVFTKGQGFGELELMYDQPCRATVEAVDDVVTWRIDRSTYQHIVMVVASKRREELTELLRHVDVLTKVQSEDRITMLADALEEAHFEKGQHLIRRGETPEWMYIILAGDVDVIGEEGGQDKLVCSFGRGTCVGELEFLNNHASVANVVAQSHVRTGKLHRSHFERVMGPIAELLKQNAQTEDYAYYREALGGFSFGEEGEAGATPTAVSPGMADSSGAPAAGKRQKREAVSAECYDEEEAKNFVPRVVEKTPEEVASIEKALSKNLLFSAVRGEAAHMKVVIDAMERAEFKREDTPMMQGEVGGEHWYVIETGTCEIVKNNEVVAVFGEGDGFGEMELMYACRTAATVRVTSETMVCWRLDRATYRHVIMRASQERRQRYKDALGGVEFLQVLSQWQQDQLADALQPTNFSAGDYIVRHGDDHSSMHIIATGECEVVGRDDAGEKQHVCDLGHGEMIGELEFLHPQPSVADVIAKTDVSTLRLERQHFELCMGPVKDFIEKVALSDKYKYYRHTSKLAPGVVAAAGEGGS
eukprot:TRINITY_DN914_c3_g1_i1.p1 TRINITY_DN914_c3_g1~~TRINITY_DN914_c3_g1_i1.p1  ORF type:complete len:1037 (+),score=375.98 TRINITY_DN914_c3_g1_i1:115-3225(+)